MVYNPPLTSIHFMPGFCSNSTLCPLGREQFEGLQQYPKADRMKIPTLLDILTAADKLNGALPPSDASNNSMRPAIMPTAVNKDGTRVANAHDDKKTVVHEFLDGTERDVDFFQKLKPKYFFICSHLKYYLPDVGTAQRDVITPVIFKNKYYYVIPSEENCKVYRVCDPSKTFFSSEGHEVLQIILGAAFGYGRISFDKNPDGTPSRVYCIPNGPHRGPANVWDSSTLAEISEMVPFATLSTPGIPEGSKFSVQVVDVCDTGNVIDIVTDDD